MNNAFFVVNISNHVVQNSRDSFQDAARRWGADYVEITENDFTPPYPPQMTKLEAFKLCDADRIFCLDADTIIWEGTPNPFDVVTPGCFFAVQNKQPHMGHYNDAGRIIEKSEFDKIYGAGFKKLDFNFEMFINSGMWVGTRKYHEDVMKRALHVALTTGTLGWWDQAALNYALAESRTTLQIANPTWNWCLPNFGQWQHMEKYIYHFAGMPDRLKILPQVNWRQ